MLLVREELVEAFALLVGQQVGAGAQGPTRAMERVARAAPVTSDGLLDPPPALVERLASQARHVKGIHHGRGLGEFLGGISLEAGEPVHRDDLDSLTPHLGSATSQLLNACCDRPSIMSNKRRPSVVLLAGRRGMTTLRDALADYLRIRRRLGFEMSQDGGCWKGSSSSSSGPAPNGSPPRCPCVGTAASARAPATPGAARWAAGLSARSEPAMPTRDERSGSRGRDPAW